jgi:peroxiredoxin Q/BCP
MIALNALAPDFEALTTDGKRLRLSERRGRPLVLYFFPKAFTPGCTREAREFRDAHPDILALHADVVGVSTDSHETQCEFHREVGASFPMVSDPDGAIARRYDVVWPLLKLTKRVTFVLDAGGVIRGIFHHELLLDRHVRSVLQTLRTLPAAAPPPAPPARG